ncbi:MAG: bifunctional precorrin-2 dehydrogenase/sirohydrochlorin ferrochelatase [Lentisphaerae bacterium]|jgi:precorrin-2 dehydrogenase/sirohydrochlorin ferrochelatase|nr:bifunctional precorrin-2 dehydrogenase/sirohydrochlorin ferrochelatase [Lentisphaerota bacterium]
MKKSDYLPISLRVGGRPCLVVGGGTIAHRKVMALLAAGAEVTVVSPALTPELQQLAVEGGLVYQEANFCTDYLEGVFLVFAATNDKDVNRTVLEECQRRGILGAAVDSNWTEGDFISAAVLRQGDVVVSISTEGKDCKEAKRVKERLQQWLGEPE